MTCLILSITTLPVITGRRKKKHLKLLPQTQHEGQQQKLITTDYMSTYHASGIHLSEIRAEIGISRPQIHDMGTSIILCTFCNMQGEHKLSRIIPRVRKSFAVEEIVFIFFFCFTRRIL